VCVCALCLVQFSFCSYLEKFTDFLRLFVSVHLRRIESSPQFPIVEFLALLFKYTFNQVRLNLQASFINIQSALHCLTFTHSYAHSFTDGGANHARQQPSGREQLGLDVLLRDTSTLGLGRTTNLPVARQPTARPPELLPPTTLVLLKTTIILVQIVRLSTL